MNHIQLNETVLAVVLRQDMGKWRGAVNGRLHDIAWQKTAPNQLLLTVDGVETAVSIAEHDGTYFLHGYGRTFTATVENPLTKAGVGAGDSANTAVAPMPGTVVSVAVSAGDNVSKGQLLMTIESMKMLTDINASRDGIVETIHLGDGETFDKNALLVTLESNQ